MEATEEGEQQNDFIAEIDELLSTYHAVHSEVLAQQLIPLIKKAFGTIFLMDYQHTFEELVHSLEHFDTCCMNIRNTIDKLTNKELELLSKKTPEAVNQIRTLQHKVRRNKQQYASCRRIAELLENNKVRKTVVDFCKKLSHLQFSGTPMSHEESSKLLFHFLWIVNHFTFDFEDEPKGAISKIFIRKKDHGGHSIEELMDETRAHLDAHQAQEATHSYKELLKRYRDLQKEQKAKHYGEIFILWFEIHFYEHRTPRN